MTDEPLNPDETALDVHTAMWLSETNRLRESARGWRAAAIRERERADELQRRINDLLARAAPPPSFPDTDE